MISTWLGVLSTSLNWRLEHSKEPNSSILDDIMVISCGEKLQGISVFVFFPLSATKKLENRHFGTKNTLETSLESNGLMGPPYPNNKII